MILWFGLIAATGIVNIVSFPGILRAFDPSRAVLRMPLHTLTKSVRELTKCLSFRAHWEL